MTEPYDPLDPAGRPDPTGRPDPAGRLGSAPPPVSSASRAVPAEELAAEASYARYRSDDRSLGEIASDLLTSASTLLRQEVELAKAEAKQSATRAGKGVGLLVGAGVFGLLALFALTLALWWWLAKLIGGAADPAFVWGALATMAIWAVVAAILAAAGRSALNKVQGLPRTTDTVTKIPNAATGNEEKNR